MTVTADAMREAATRRTRTGGWLRAADFIYRKLRLRNPWNYKAPFLISLPYFMIAVGGIPWPEAMLGLAASLCTIAGIAGTAYFLNDLADADKDRLAGRENAVDGLGPLERALFLGVFLAAALGPWLYLPVTTATGSLLAAELALFVLYCFPPFRLKERGALGVMTDSAYAHTIPAVLAVLTFSAMARRPYPDLFWFLASLAAWQFSLGIRNIVLHQLQDYPNDVASGTRTMATGIGPERTEAALGRWIVPFEILTFAAFASVVSRSIALFVPAYVAFLCLTLLRTRLLRTRAAPSTLRERLYVYLDDFYVDWLPLIVLAHLVAAAPLCWPLLVVHLLLFRNGLGAWGRELRGLALRWTTR